MDKTTNYQLPQWEESDRIRMKDFNDAFSSIDKALAKKCEVVFGTYTGDGQPRREIVLGFKPKAVLVLDQCGRVYNDNRSQPGYNGGLALENSPVLTEAYSEINHTVLEVTETGFAVAYKSVSLGSGTFAIITTNGAKTVYHYIAFV